MSLLSAITVAVVLNTHSAGYELNYGFYGLTNASLHCRDIFPNTQSKLHKFYETTPPWHDSNVHN